MTRITSFLDPAGKISHFARVGGFQFMEKSLFRLIFAVAVFVATQSAPASQLNMFFTNTGVEYSATNTWITIQRGQNPSTAPTQENVPGVTYGANQFVWNTYTNVLGTNTQVGNLFANSVLLQDINAAGGLTWTSNAPSAVVYISYGAPLPVSNYSLSGISPSATSDASYNIPYTTVELTYYGGNDNDQGDITAINYFTAPVRVSNYASTNATGTPISTVGFNPTAPATAAMLSQFQQITGGSTNTILSNTNGQITRVLGPTQFGAGQPNAADFGGFTNFATYFGSLTNTTTVFSNQSGYNTVQTPDTNVAYTNANVVFVLTNQVSSTTNGYAFTATGDITTTKIGYDVGGTPISTNVHVSTNVVFAVTPGAGESELAAAFTYYGDYSPSTNITMGGSGWADFTNTIAGFVDGGNNPAANIVRAQIPGELSAGYSAGFPGSTNTVAQFGSTNLGSLPSGEWWNLNPVVAFADVQSTNGFFNEYANIIYQNSSNSVYGMTYSDRFNNGSPYVSAAPSVGSWLVELGDPLHAIPEPTFAVATIVFFIGFAAYKGRIRRKKA